MCDLRHATLLAAVLAVLAVLGSGCERGPEATAPGSDGLVDYDGTSQLFAPSNDDFANPTVIAALPFTNTVDMSDATTEAGEPTPSCSFGSSGRTVWYTFTPAETRSISASFDAPFANVVAAYTGTSLAALTEVRCTAAFGGKATFLAEAGTTYHFQVDGLFGQTGSVEFRLEAIPPPPNDDFADATAIAALPYTAAVDLTSASRETGEALATCAPFENPEGRTAWFTFTPNETASLTASIVNAPTTPVVAAYTGSSLASLTEVSCRAGFGQPATFRANAGTTYYIQVDALHDLGGSFELRLEVAQPPVAQFGSSTPDPSVFDVVQFFNSSFDPAGVGFEPEVWDLGDGTAATGCCPTHRYAADGDYAVQLTVTTVDGRTASTTQTVLVRTHDVAITQFSVPKAVSAGQTRQVVVGLNSRRYPETVEVQLFKSVPGGYQFVGVLTQSVPVRPSNRTTDFQFSYTFTAADAQVGKVTFKAVANVLGGRDALPADNEAIARPTKVSRQ